MLEKIVNDLIREDSREEALEILKMANKNEIYDFNFYYKKESFNICCMIIDTIKDRLIGEGKMKYGGDFGNLTKKLYDTEGTIEW